MFLFRAFPIAHHAQWPERHKCLWYIFETSEGGKRLCTSAQALQVSARPLVHFKLKLGFFHVYCKSAVLDLNQNNKAHVIIMWLFKTVGEQMRSE